METRKVKITEIKNNTNNPRFIKDDKFKKLVRSIKEFPEMLELRPIVVDKDNIVLGGNMRLRACKEAGLKEVHIVKADQLTEEQQREFIIKDNVGFGEWDWDNLANEWDTEKLEDWGLELPLGTDILESGEVEFSAELDQQSNYVVLKFDKDIDFLQIQQMLDLKTVSSKRKNGKPWSKGVGRVIDGTDALLKIKEW
tara:strand:- start:1628 stop:2218 length:591 start_codon:yes stop_codon:yes gene_type:complete